MVTVLAAWVIGQGDTLVMDKYALMERLKRVEVAWETASPAIRRKATTDLTNATVSLFAGGGDRAANSLDRALAALESRSLRPADAITIRAARPFSEPLSPITVRLDWAYKPASVLPITVKSGNKTWQVTPGTDTTITVDPSTLNPDLRQNPEVGYLIPVTVGGDPRLAYVSFVRNFPARAQALAKSADPFVSYVGQRLQGYQQNPETIETDLPLIQAVFSAEAMAEGRRTLADQDQVYMAKANETPFRAVFPRSLRGRTGVKATVVIALHGAGASENQFFEAQGRGAIVEETMNRGWAFVAPRSGATAIADVLQWLRNVRKLQVDRVFLVGHGMGASVVLGSDISPTAIAVFAPPGGRLDPKTPTFLAVGKQDIPLIRSACTGMMNGEAARPDLVFREFDPCEHQMLSGEAATDAFRFFDRIAKG